MKAELGLQHYFKKLHTDDTWKKICYYWYRLAIKADGKNITIVNLDLIE